MFYLYSLRHGLVVETVFKLLNITVNFRFTPLGVLSLSLVAVADISDIGQVFRALAMFILAVTSALIVQQLIVMPLILFTLTRMNPFKLMLDISRPWLIAFAAAST